MKKSILVYMLISIMILVSACNAENEPGMGQEDFHEDVSTDLQEDKREQIEDSEEPIGTDQAEANKGTNIRFEEEVLIEDFLTFTLNESEWVEEIKPFDTSGSYSYYEKQPGEIYLLVRGQIKNLFTDTVSISNFTTNYNFKVNNQYNYQGDASIGLGSHLEDRLKPLQHGEFYIYASVPEEVEEIMEEFKLEIEFGDGVNYITDDEDVKHSYILQVNY